ncbi:RNA binding motif protein 12Ba [Hippocampus comes]|uniref:RNA binding motif protein 12Ba n=1 Tax=Hippocampus comes TaxID=109280 RepID=UPI00094E843A|nr:PREDICTED: RNA-binding protein 12-like [Hippocampus comes]
MAHVVKLKGLDVNASAEDIRDFFPRLHIPVRGVWIWILGGPNHEAFIAFKSQKEARRAVRHSGRTLKGSKVMIRLSCVAELEKKLQYYEKKKKHSHRVSRPRVEERSEEPQVVHPSTSPPRDPRIASASSPTILPPTVQNGDLQTFDKPHDCKIYSNIPTGGQQNFEKPCDPRIAPIVNGCPQIHDRQCDPRTIPVPSGCPQVCDELHEHRISSQIVPSDFLQMSDKSKSPQKYKPVVPSQGPLTCGEPLNCTTFSPPGDCVQNADHPETSDPLHKAFLLGVRTALESFQSYPIEQQEVLPEHLHAIMPETQTSGPGYVRLFGLPASTTKEDISLFFKGLKVAEVVVNMKLEHHHVCLVKFDDKQDSIRAEQFNNQYMGPICVEVRKATEKMWKLGLEECESGCHNDARNSLRDTANRKQKFRLEENHNSVKKGRLFPACKEYIVKVCNLPLLTTKTELREVFDCHEMEKSKIQHLLDKNGDRTDTAFLIFHRMTDCEHAMSRDGWLLGSGHIQVSIINRDEMMDMKRKNDWPLNLSKRKSHARSEMMEKNLGADANTCLLVQNMSEYMKETLMLKFSQKYNITTDDIITLNDGKASCTAMVQLKSFKLVSMAHKLAQDLLGENAIIKRITATQMNIFANEGLR